MQNYVPRPFGDGLVNAKRATQATIFGPPIVPPRKVIRGSAPRRVCEPAQVAPAVPPRPTGTDDADDNTVIKRPHRMDPDDFEDPRPDFERMFIPRQGRRPGDDDGGKPKIAWKDDPRNAAKQQSALRDRLVARHGIHDGNTDPDYAELIVGVGTTRDPSDRTRQIAAATAVVLGAGYIADPMALARRVLEFRATARISWPSEIPPLLGVVVFSFAGNPREEEERRNIDMYRPTVLQMDGRTLSADDLQYMSGPIGASSRTAFTTRIYISGDPSMMSAVWTENASFAETAELVKRAREAMDAGQDPGDFGGELTEHKKTALVRWLYGFGAQLVKHWFGRPAEDWDSIYVERQHKLRERERAEADAYIQLRYRPAPRRP